MLFITTNTCNQDTYYYACCFSRRKNALILRTQLTVRVHAVIGKCIISLLLELWSPSTGFSCFRQDSYICTIVQCLTPTNPGSIYRQQKDVHGKIHPFRIRFLCFLLSVCDSIPFLYAYLWQLYLLKHFFVVENFNWPDIDRFDCKCIFNLTVS